MVHEKTRALLPIPTTRFRVVGEAIVPKEILVSLGVMLDKI